MSLFKPAQNTMAFFKAGFMGEAGSGKTHTSTLVAIGLVQHLRALKIEAADKPVFMLDTENGSSWVKPMFDEAGIELRVAKTRAFKDLVTAVNDAKEHSSLLFIDSITHFWEELQASYMANKRYNKGRLEFQDWAYIKGEWRKFSDAFVSSELHCILSGRLGWEYEHTEDERGKKQIEKSGAKMQAEKGLGYEPNLLVWMERNMNLQTKEINRTATVLKDRSRRLDGLQISNPTFETFLPHIEFMAIGGKHETVDIERNSQDTMPDDDYSPEHNKSLQRQIIIDKIQDLLTLNYGASADDKKARIQTLEAAFGTSSKTAIEKTLPSDDLRIGYDRLWFQFTGDPGPYGTSGAGQPLDDEIPDFDTEKPVAAE